MRISDWSSDVCSSEVSSLQAPSLYTSHGAGDVRVYADRAVLARAQRRTWLAGGVAVGIALVLAWLSQRWLQRRGVHPLRQLRDPVGEQPHGRESRSESAWPIVEIAVGAGKRK